jgi:hypothetical protein
MLHTDNGRSNSESEAAVRRLLRRHKQPVIYDTEMKPPPESRSSLKFSLKLLKGPSPDNSILKGGDGGRGRNTDRTPSPQVFLYVPL